MINHYKNALLLLFLLCSVHLFGQQTKRVLFLGNSYTYVNNLPQLVASAAASTGKTLIFDMYAQGGYYLADHLTDTVSLAKVAAGGWDHVVLQDQSMALAYPMTYLNLMPYTAKLDSIIKVHNPCAQTLFYSTWGRKNGDSYYVCLTPNCDSFTLVTRTYYEMDSAIQVHYKVFADSLKASMTPVGTVWRYIRRNYPSIELYQPDESHPSLEGSYAAACAFYATIFRSDPAAITYNPGISATDAANIRNAAKLVVYNHLSAWNVGVYDSLLNRSCTTLGVHEGTRANEQWTVFPNPVTDVLHVTFPSKGSMGTVCIYNSLGILVKEVFPAQTTRISFRELPEGLYFIRCGREQRTVKVLKQ